MGRLVEPFSVTPPLHEGGEGAGNDEKEEKALRSGVLLDISTSLSFERSSYHHQGHHHDHEPHHHNLHDPGIHHHDPHDHAHDDQAHNHNHNHANSSCSHDHTGWRKYAPHSHSLEARLHADTRSLFIAFSILLAAFSLQLGGGIIASSSVLVVEAVHSALDGITVVISLISVFVARRAPTPRMSYGFGRAEVLSALISIVALALMCFKLFISAFHRLSHVLQGTLAPIHVEGRVVFIAEALALIGNIFMTVVLTRNSTSLNLRALRAHVIADSIENMIVLFAGLIMWLVPRAAIIDPILSMAIVFLIVFLNFGIASETIATLMQAAPLHVDVTSLRKRMLKDVPHIVEVGRTHVWTLTSGSVIASAVVYVDAKYDGLVEHVKKLFVEAGVHEVVVEVCDADGISQKSTSVELGSPSGSEGEELVPSTRYDHVLDSGEMV